MVRRRITFLQTTDMMSQEKQQTCFDKKEGRKRFPCLFKKNDLNFFSPKFTHFFFINDYKLYTLDMITHTISIFNYIIKEMLFMYNIYHKYFNEAATYSLELDKQKKASIIPKDK